MRPAVSFRRASLAKGRINMLGLLKKIKTSPGGRRRLFLALPIAFAVLIAALLCALLLPREQPSPAEETPEPGEEAQTLLVTAETMARLSYTDSALGELTWELTEESLLDLNRVLVEYDICTPDEISHFLAQVTVETGAGRDLTEQGDAEYFQSHGYTTGTRGAGYLHLTYEYGQMAFSVWMMKKYVPQLRDITYHNPACHDSGEVTAAYYAALQQAANRGLDVSSYSRIVYDSDSPMTTGADYIAQSFAWESAGYYWFIAGIGELLSSHPGLDNVDLVSERIGGAGWQSRREAYMAFYPILAES